MDAPAAAPKPCCVCAAQNGKHCAKCKSRHYCSKACQLVDWKRGHNKACKQLAKEFQDRLLDELMPEKKPKEEPPIVEDVAPADGSKARLSAVRAAKTAESNAPNDDAPSWRGTCAICLDVLPVIGDEQFFYECCCKKICNDCHNKCWQHDKRCPLCRAPPLDSDAEWLRRLQKHVDKGNAEAQIVLGGMYRDGGPGLQQNFKRAVQLYELAAAQGHAAAQTNLATCYYQAQGVELDYKTAAQLYQRAAEQGFPPAQYSFGIMFYHGKGVAQSYDEAVKWFRLAAAQGHAEAQNNLALCYCQAQGVELDYKTAAQLYQRAAEQGYPLAQYSFGTMFYHGKGVAQSYDVAVKWFRLAVAQGHAGALLNLGVCHANGQGVWQDFEEARRLFKRAAAKGHVGAAPALDALAAALVAAW